MVDAIHAPKGGNLKELCGLKDSQTKNQSGTINGPSTANKITFVDIVLTGIYMPFFA